MEKIHLEWTAVENATGYLVEIKNEKGEVTRQESETTRLNLRLPVGQYMQRVGALNIFRKPSSWSEWKELVVMKPVAPKVASVVMNDDSAEAQNNRTRSVTLQGENFFEGTKVSLVKDGQETPVQTQRQGDSTLAMVLILDRDKLEPGKNRIKIENPGGKVQMADIDIPGDGGDAEPKGPPRYLALLPGVYQWEDGRRVESSLWMTAFAGSLLGFASEHRSAELAARDAKSNTLTFFFSNAVLFSSAQNKSSLLTMGLFNDEDSKKSRESFNIHDRNRKYFGAAAAGILLINVHAALPYKAEYLLPGLTEFKSGQTITGAAMMTGTGLLAGGLASSYVRAQQMSRNAANDPTYKILNDTGMLLSVLSTTSFSRDTYLYWYTKAADRSSHRARFDQYQQTQAICAVSLTGLYLYHIVTVKQGRSAKTADTKGTDAKPEFSAMISANPTPSGKLDRVTTAAVSMRVDF